MTPKEPIRAESRFLGHPETRVAGTMEIENILCPVDFSEFSLKALSYATCIARHLRSRLFVQHTIHLATDIHPGNSDWMADSSGPDAALQQAAAKVRRLAAVPRLHLREVRMLVNEGDVFERLVESIQQHRIDLIVMGTGAHTGLNCDALGSLSERIVRHSTCPVLLVGHPQRDFVQPDESHPVRLKSLVFATDFSANSHHVLARTVNWATRWSAKISLFHAVEDSSAKFRNRPDLSQDFKADFEKQLAAACEIIHERGSAAADKVEIESEVRLGVATEEILRFAEEQDADLIVLGSRGLGMAANQRGSTISGVLRDGRFPVLAVPQPAV